MRSPVYWHPAIYSAVMRLLYGQHFEERYTAIAGLIPEGASVTELCAGDAYLYSNYLKTRNVTYTGLDINPAFVRHATRMDIDFRQFDVTTDPVPPSDYVIMQASLYQFMPDEQGIIASMIAAARKAVIVAEPVRNLADSSNPLIGTLARYAANPGGKHMVKRFNAATLATCFERHPEFDEMRTISGGREMIGIFRK